MSSPEAPEEAIRQDLYDGWKREGRHWEEYAAEFGGTAVLLLCVVGAVGCLFGASSPLPHWVPSARLRLLLVGLALGGASGLVTLSPPGRLSGAHLNPAMSAGFWLLGKMHGRDLLGYVAAQLAGGLVGTLAGRAVFGRLATEVHSATLAPGPHVGWVGTLGGEVASTFVLAFAVFTFVSHAKLARWTPLMAVFLVGLLVCVDGSYSGAGMNPARWFGPAAAAPLWQFGLIYALAPVLAALLAAAGRRSGVLTHPIPHTAKLFHDPGYRSIFLGDRIPSRPPEEVLRKRQDTGR